MRKRAVEIEPEEPTDLAAQMLRYLEWLSDRAYADSTVYGRGSTWRASSPGARSATCAALRS